MMSLVFGIYKIQYKWTYLQSRNRPTDVENKPVVAKEAGEERTGSVGLADANHYL